LPAGFTSTVLVLAIILAPARLQANGTLTPWLRDALISRLANWPTSSHEESAHPRGVPAPVARVSDSYEFLAHQSDGKTPVAYDPCRPIHYVIRTQGEPQGCAQIVADAVSRVSRATGLRFVYDGTTAEAPSRLRSPYQPERYGDRWAPVLISWVVDREEEDSALGLLGRGGSFPVGLPFGPDVYVTGQVRLDPSQLTRILHWHNGKLVVRAIVLHELGHLVGLGHVTDATQLMYPRSQPEVTDFGAGDLTGLAALGKGVCKPDL
jgi:hypothetical protein